MSKVIRGVKNVTKGYSAVQVKVRNATSNDPWGPVGIDLAEIAALTFNSPTGFYQITDMLDKRLNDKAKNWRHVLKSLQVLEYCLHEGSERIVTWARKNIYTVKTLRDFQYIDKDGRDVGLCVRIVAKKLVALIIDEERLRSERSDRRRWRARVTGLVGDVSAAPDKAAARPRLEAITPYSGGDDDGGDDDGGDDDGGDDDDGDDDDDDDDDDEELRLALELSKQEEERRQRELESPSQYEPPRICGPDCVFKRLRQVPCDNSLVKNIDKALGGRGSQCSAALDSHTLESPYKPLRRWQTRLVQIVPTSGEIPKCSLTTVEFIDMYGVGIAGTDEIVTYSAISYVWGKQDDCAILCNDYPVQASRNLAKFLSHLSRPRLAASTSEYYWCDALCIDQQNPTEKAFQVRNMLRIFEKADRVLGWLRPRDSVETLGGEPLLYAISSLQQLQDPQVKYHEEQCAENLARAQKYLREVCDDTFFQRIWIRQEMFAARRISLFLGGQYHSPDNQFDGMVSSLFQWLSLDAENPTRKALESDDPLIDGRFRVDPRFQIMVRHFQHNGTDRHEYRPPAERRRYSVHWLRTLQDGGSFYVTDPRDRVYGILGIISSTTTRLYVEDRPDIKTQNFPINYDKTVSEVYQDVVRFLIDTDRNLDCLTVFEDRRGLPSDLPSWATDWRRDVARSFIGVDADSTEDRAKYGLAVKQVDLQPGQLRVEGIRYFLIRSMTAIKSWPKELLKAKAEREPHALFNTMGWMDDAIVDLAPCYARCDHLESLQDQEAVFHKPLLNAGSKFLQLFVPRTTMLDDVIVFLKSARCLFVLHPVHGKESFFKLVGPVLGHQPVWTSDRNVPRPRRTVFRMNLTGLSPETSWQDLKDFARNSGLLDVVYSETGRDREGKGYGFLEFESSNDLKNAVEKLDGREFKGATVHCTPDIAKDGPLDDCQFNESPWSLHGGVLQDVQSPDSRESFVLV